MAASNSGCVADPADFAGSPVTLAPVQAPLFARLDITSRSTRLTSVTNGAGATLLRLAIA